MRLDARTHSTRGWTIWHCEECRRVRGVLWFDDETNEYAVVRFDGIPLDRIILMLIVGDIPIDVIRAKKIRILLERRLALINPLDDPAPEADKADTPTGIVETA